MHLHRYRIRKNIFLCVVADTADTPMIGRAVFGVLAKLEVCLPACLIISGPVNDDCLAVMLSLSSVYNIPEQIYLLFHQQMLMADRAGQQSEMLGFWSMGILSFLLGRCQYQCFSRRLSSSPPPSSNHHHQISFSNVVSGTFGGA